ncbi:MAG: two-component system, cell cycle sensor histidine kinase and response regulator CckA, partial [Thermodesulfobacteriota bacterium]|nr:two-component system, cell cycle sensor histidine kinase and response regulator CckA [Thermodesulfobacteriota bacterium]
MKVLIVDDNDENRYMLETLLRGHGYDVLLAHDGLEALDLLRSSGAGLIISDILMPRMDGFQLCREVRADGDLKKIPLIFYTATYTSEEDKEFALSLGVDQFLVKPDDLELLGKTITQFLAEPKTHVENPLGDEMEFFRQYNRVLFRKLEKKVADLVASKKKLQDSEERYRGIFENAAVGIDVVDANGRFVRVNSSLCNMLGYSEDELMDLTIVDVTHPEDIESSEIQHQSLVRGETDSYRFEKRYLTKDGRVVWADVCVTALHGPGGVYAGTIGVITNITDRKRSEEELENSEMFLQQVVENIPDMIFVKDAENLRFVRFNKAGEELLGYSREDLLGKNDYDLFPLEQADFFIAKDKEVLASGRLLEIPEEEIDTKLKGKRFLHTKKIPIFDANGASLFLLGISSDITDRKLSDQESENLRLQLFQAQKMEAVGTLASGIAHDFNNMLQAVSGYSEIMLQRKKEGERDYSDLQKIYQAGQRGADLVKSLMTFSRKIETEHVPVNLNQEIDHIQSILSHTIPKTIRIELCLSSDLESIQADPSQIGQVLMNLGVNARDAMPNGGTLPFQTEDIELDEEYCRTHFHTISGRYVLLTVSDTGHGMDKETLAHIFEPFFTTKETGKGTGLGLATVYGIVKQHDGHITCYSEPRHGTAFKIYFPAIETEGRSATPTFDAAIRCGTETILLVDDEEVLSELGKALLSRFGYDVITAGNGKDALEIYQRERESISLVILDLIMPVMDGRQCLREILRID